MNSGIQQYMVIEFEFILYNLISLIKRIISLLLQAYQRYLISNYRLALECFG